MDIETQELIKELTNVKSHSELYMALADNAEEVKIEIDNIHLLLDSITEDSIIIASPIIFYTLTEYFNNDTDFMLGYDDIKDKTSLELLKLKKHVIIDIDSPNEYLMTIDLTKIVYKIILPELNIKNEILEETDGIVDIISTPDAIKYYILPMI